MDGNKGIKSHKGIFTPINPGKYSGNAKNIIYRSSWELICMRRFDIDPNILTWASEELAIPYVDRASGRQRRYFPDFVIKKLGKDGQIKVIIIEIKPYAQSVPPERGTKTERRFLTECKTFATNYSKWEYAKAWATAKGWEFVVLTERQLGIR